MNETTRARLINAARRAFTRRGFDAASVRDITADAGANLGAVTYHFGSKQGLYDAVMDAAFEPFEARLAAARAAARAESRAFDRVRCIIEAVFDHLETNPDLQYLVLQNIATRHAVPAALGRLMANVLPELVGHMIAGQAEGSFRAGDPVLLAISAMSQPAYFGMVGSFAPAGVIDAGRASFDPGSIRAHALAFIEAGLARPGAEEET
jgi:AcrR family transcriptional regulator